MKVIVYGSRADGHAKVVIEVLAPHAGVEVIGLLDDYAENVERTVCGMRVLGTKHDLRRLRSQGVEGVVLGFGAARGRGLAIAAVEEAGLSLPVLRHPRAHVARSATVGDGSQLLPGSIVGPGVRIDRGVLVNSGAIVEHDVQIEEGAVIDPGAVLAGRCAVGAESEIGTGAVLLPDVVVGPRAIVGAGAVVTRPVAPDTVAIGIPARARARSTSGS